MTESQEFKKGDRVLAPKLGVGTLSTVDELYGKGYVKPDFDSVGIDNRNGGLGGVWIALSHLSKVEEPEMILLELNRYQRDNLLSALLAIAQPGISTPMQVANTGDWAMELISALGWDFQDETSLGRPNCSHELIAKRATEWTAPVPSKTLSYKSGDWVVREHIRTADDFAPGIKATLVELTQSSREGSDIEMWLVLREDGEQEEWSTNAFRSYDYEKSLDLELDENILRAADAWVTDQDPYENLGLFSDALVKTVEAKRMAENPTAEMRLRAILSDWAAAGHSQSDRKAVERDILALISEYQQPVFDPEGG